MPLGRVQEIIQRAAGERQRLLAFVRSVPQESWGNRSPDGKWQAFARAAQAWGEGPRQ